MHTILRFWILIIFGAISTKSVGQNKFVLSPKVGFSFNNRDFVEPETYSHSPYYLFIELDLQYKFKNLGLGVRTSRYSLNSIKNTPFHLEGLNPDVHNILFYEDPGFQSTIHINYWCHSLYGFYTLNLGSKLSLDLRTGVSWAIGEETQVDLISDGDFAPTRTFFKQNRNNEPDWYKSVEFNYQLTDNKRIGIGINESFYRWATYASFGVSF